MRYRTDCIGGDTFAGEHQCAVLVEWTITARGIRSVAQTRVAEQGIGVAQS